MKQNLFWRTGFVLVTTYCLLATDVGTGVAAHFRLPGSDGQTHSRPDSVSVIVFLSPECPMSNRSIPEIARLHSEFAGQNVSWFGVLSGSKATRERARQYQEEYRLPFPVLVDNGRTLARATGATVTPETVVLDRRGALVYRGRINDLYVDYGKTRREATQHDLRDALTSVLRGEPVLTPRTRVFGCAIAR